MGELSDNEDEEAEAFKGDDELAAKLARWNVNEEEVGCNGKLHMCNANMWFLTLQDCVFTQIGLIFHKYFSDPYFFVARR